MQPFMKNVSVEYAEKAAPGGEIDTKIKALEERPSGTKLYLHNLDIAITDNNVQKTLKAYLISTYNGNMTVNMLYSIYKQGGGSMTIDGKQHIGYAMRFDFVKNTGNALVPTDIFRLQPFSDDVHYAIDKIAYVPYIYSFTGGLISDVDNHVVQNVAIGSTGIVPTSITDTVTPL